MQQLPNLLAGYYWFQNNGLLSIPWFNPAQCGGVPFYADAGHGFYSLPQLLVLVFNPVLAIRITFFVFALAGYFGFYFLVKRKFRINQPFALLGATLFLFNGFYTHRMMIGHPFHAFMLLPWLAISLLPAPGEPPEPLRKNVYRIATAGAIIAYMFHSAMMHIIPPVILAITVILVIYSFLHGKQRIALIRLGAAIVLALGLCSSKLVASLSFLQQFPRSYYPLPGFPRLLDAMSVVTQSVFFRPPAGQIYKLITNARWAIEQHELEFGVSPLPLVFILAAMILYLFVEKRGKPNLSKRAVVYASVVILLLFIPVAVNLYHPTWNAILKNIPVIKSSSLLLRWFAMYIPISILAAILLANSLAIANRHGAWIALASIIFVIVYQATENRTYYDAQTYDGAPIKLAYEQSKSTGVIVPIRGIATGNITIADRTLSQNDLMVAGLSQLACYNATFGYRLEWFPVGDLHPGPALEVQPDHLNVKNPSCYVFPQANNCSPGDHFKIERQADAEKFLAYKPFTFEKSSLQKAADVCNVVFLLLLCSILIHPGVTFAIGKLGNRSSRMINHRKEDG